jgi:hypothetical protein
LICDEKFSVEIELLTASLSSLGIVLVAGTISSAGILSVTASPAIP